MIQGLTVLWVHRSFANGVQFLHIFLFTENFLLVNCKDCGSHSTRMSRDYGQLSLILALHFISFISVVLLMAYFLYFEYVKFGNVCTRILENKFVRFTLIGSFSILSGAILYFEYFFSHYGLSSNRSMTNEQEAVLLFVYSMVGLGACLSHVCLLYLRTKGIFETNKILMKFMQIMTFAFLIFLVLSMATGIGVLIPSPANSQFNTAFTLFTGGYGISMSLLDIVTTVSFARYVRDIGKNLKAQTYADKTIRSTQIVARFGIGLSTTSLVTVIGYIVERSVNDEMTKEFIFVFVVWGFTLVSLLWTIMKIQLDRISNDGEPPRVKMSKAGSDIEQGNPRTPVGSISQPLIDTPMMKLTDLRSPKDSFASKTKQSIN
jgi:hypothetical protein